jgi:hypothetical protein
MAQVGGYAGKTQDVLDSTIVCTLMYISHAISNHFYFSLQVKNKPHDGVAICAFVLELGIVTYSTILVQKEAYISRWTIPLIKEITGTLELRVCI